MGYSVGQYTTTDTSGVGTTQNNTGSTAQPAYGGKGGGTVTQPTTTTSNALAQPAQASTNPYATTIPAGAPTVKPTPTPVFGKNAFGYNMARLSQRMDPSATLPAPKTQTAQPETQPQAQQATGGKGGGYGVTVEDLNNLGSFLASPFATGVDFGASVDQKPYAAAGDQTNQQPNQQPNQPSQQPYGVSGSQPYSAYSTDNFGYGPQQPQGYTAAGQNAENPFATQLQQYQDYQKQLKDMQAQFQSQLDSIKTQNEELVDTGETLRPLPGDADYIYSQTEEEAQAQAEEAKKIEERNKQLAQVYKKGATGADINKYFGDVLNIDAGAVVDKNGNIVVYNPKNAKEYIRIPKNSYVDENGNIIKPDGSKVNIPTSYLAETSDKAKYSQGIQYGDTIQDVKDYFGGAEGLAVSDKAKINTAGTVILEGGTQIPAGSYVDTDGKLRYPSGKLIPINAKDKPTYKDDTALAALDKFTPKGGYKDYVTPTVKVAADFDPYIKAQKAEMDIAKKALDAAMKTGSEKAIKEAQSRYDDQKADYDAVMADKSARMKAFSAAVQAKEKERLKKRADEAKALIRPTAQSTANRAGNVTQNLTGKVNLSNVGQKITSTSNKANVKKKAHGGVIHNGMSNRLKHMLGED